MKKMKKMQTKRKDVSGFNFLKIQLQMIFCNQHVIQVDFLICITRRKIILRQNVTRVKHKCNPSSPNDTLARLKHKCNNIPVPNARRDKI